MYKRRRYARKRTARAMYLQKPLWDPTMRRQAMVDQYNNQEARGTANSLTKYGPSARSANQVQRMNRMLAGWKGRGDYRSFFSQFVPKGSFAWAGRQLGGMSGIPGATALGSWAGNKLSNYTGFGDYGGDAGGNQIMSGSMETPIQVNQSDDLTGDITVQHREFLGNVTATGGSGNISSFANLAYAINPGLVATLPWLSQIAQNFELFEFQGLIFEFKPTSGELGATGTNSLGKVVMATNYDPDAPLFTSTIQMENYDYANACKPSEHMLHGVETAPKQRATSMLYVRTGTSPKDKVLTDIGNFQLATEGLPITNGTTAIVGELWVTYACKLSRAQLFGSLLGNQIVQDSFWGYSGTTNLIAGSQTQVATSAWASRYNTPSVTTAAARLTNTIGGNVTSASTSALTYSFPANIIAGTYRIRLWIYLVAPVTNYVATLAFANCANLPLLGAITGEGGGTTTFLQSSAAVSISNILTAECYTTVAAPGSLIATVTFNLNSAASSGATLILDVIQVPSSLAP